MVISTHLYVLSEKLQMQLLLFKHTRKVIVVAVILYNNLQEFQLLYFKVIATT
jgi:hypothetical protein